METNKNETNEIEKKDNKRFFIIESISSNDLIKNAIDLLLEGLKISPIGIGLKDLQLTCYQIEKILENIEIQEKVIAIDISGNKLIETEDPNILFKTLEHLNIKFPNALILLNSNQSHSKKWISFIELLIFINEEEFLIKKLVLFKFSDPIYFKPESQKFRELSKIWELDINMQKLATLYLEKYFEKLRPKYIGNFYGTTMDLSGETMEKQTGRRISYMIWPFNSNTIENVTKRLLDYSGLDNIKTLILRNNYIGNEENLETLFEFIDKELKNLEILDLAHNQLTEKCVKALAKIISRDNFEYLDIYKNLGMNSEYLADLILKELIDNSNDNFEPEKAAKELLKIFPMIKTLEKARIYSNQIVRNSMPDYKLKIICKSSVDINEESPELVSSYERYYKRFE